jgi:tetratricopeptide (TPR) repeat protein
MPDATVADRPAAPRPESGLPAGPPGFELLEEVGRGGMGAVYRAWDAEFGREVAVKLLRPDLPPGHAADLSARFRDEARITGQLQHPGVPPAYRVGATADGRPFLAMKLVHGKTLSAMLAAGEPVDAMAVFEAAAQTVGYAHAHGVVHRDLKPSNVMVGGFGEVQVMDWGLAKVLAPGRPVGGDEAPPVPGVTAERDTETLAGSVLGTPGYMAPEQAAGRLREIDARTDVFGLGGILCVLLTGQPPFPGETAESARRRAARGDTAGAFARLDASGADPGLVGLCKRCLASYRGDRPASGNAVADAVAGLRRAAEGRAVQAERDRAAADERLAQAGRRRRVLAVAAGVLLAGVAGTTAGLVRAEGKRVEAEAARRSEAEQKRVAVAKEAEATAALDFLDENVFAAARPAGQDGGLGKDTTLCQAITAAIPALDQRFASSPLVEARLRRTLGTTYLKLGDPRAAESLFVRSLELFAANIGSEHPDALRCAADLGLVRTETGRRADGLALLEPAAEAARRTLGPDHETTLYCLSKLAAGYFHAGRRADALKLKEEELAARRRTIGPDHKLTLSSMTNLAASYHAADRLGEAQKLLEEVLAARRRTLGPDHPDTLTATSNVATSYFDTDRRPEALKLREEVLAARTRVLGPDHPDTLRSLSMLAGSYLVAERLEDSVKLRKQAVDALVRTLGPDHPDTLRTMTNLANGYNGLGRRAEALTLREGVFAAMRRVHGPDHPSTLIAANNLSTSYELAGRFADALRMNQEAFAGRTRALGLNHPDTIDSQLRVAEGLADVGRSYEAWETMQNCLSRAAKPATITRLEKLRNRLTVGVWETAPPPRPKQNVVMPARTGPSPSA